jgi:hypothetical protein
MCWCTKHSTFRQSIGWLHAFLVADDADYEVEVYDASRRLDRIVRRTHAPIPLLPADSAAELDARLELLPPDLQILESGSEHVLARRQDEVGVEAANAVTLHRGR